MPKTTVAPSEETAELTFDEELAGERATGRHWPTMPVIWDYPFKLRDAAETLSKFASGAFDLSDPERAKQIVAAWKALSMVVAEEYDVIPETAGFLHQQLMRLLGDDVNEPAEELDDPDVDAAVRVAMFALFRIARARHEASPRAERSDESNDESETLRKMASLLDPLGSADPSTRRRAQIKRIVEWSASDDACPREDWIDDDECAGGGYLVEVSEEERVLRRVAYLREELGEIDPRLALDEGIATRLVERFGARKDGAGRLAANWVWRSGIEHRGVPQRGDAPPAWIAERFQRDPRKKSAARSKRSAKSVRIGTQ